MILNNSNNIWTQKNPQVLLEVMLRGGVSFDRQPLPRDKEVGEGDLT